MSAVLAMPPQVSGAAAAVRADKLVLHGITHRYAEAAAVCDIHLSVREGEIMALLGPSGCGKTTLLSIIAGLLSPSAGRVLIDGADVTRVPANKRRVGVVFQSYALFPHMTVRQNIQFGIRNFRQFVQEEAQTMCSVLELTRLEAMADRYPAQLSGGQQQRVALARALAVKPALILLDEPFSNLDAKVRETMRVELGQFLRRIGATALIVTHDQEDASHISDRVMVMHAGRAEQLGPYSELYRHPASAFVGDFLGHSNWMAGTAPKCDAGAALLNVLGRRWCVLAPRQLDPDSECAVMVRRNAMRSLRSTAEAWPASDEGCNHLPGTVEKIVHLGPKLLVWLRCGSHLVAFDAPTQVPIHEGCEVVAVLDPACCFAFAERA